MTSDNRRLSPPSSMDTPSAAPAAGLAVQQLSVAFGSVPVLHDVHLQLPPGQTLVILGESGCGKTTLLKTIAGLVPAAQGDIYLMGQRISDLPERERGAIYLDQEPLLFEHLTVRENVAFAMRLKRLAEEVIRTSVQRLLTATDLLSHAQKRHWQLSGGQKQRVAFARAVLAQPRLLLLDEPFGSLDSRTRGQMQALFAELSQHYALTSVFVTHDVREALVVGHQFARMNSGRLQLYPDRQSFICDERTGIPAEIAFWQQAAQLHAASGGKATADGVP